MLKNKEVAEATENTDDTSDEEKPEDLGVNVGEDVGTGEALG